METVHILTVVDGFNHFLLGDMLGQGKLYDETVHIRILVQFAYLGEQFLFSNVCLVADK